MLFLVDGYNVSKGDPATHALSLEDQRTSLLTRLRVRGEQLLGRGRIVVVFDGESGMAQTAAARSEMHPVEVVYSRGVSADDAIVELAAKGHGKGVCIVSSDRGVADRARAHGGSDIEVRPRETVFEGASGRRRTKSRGGIAREVGLPPGANKITRELKDIWLESEE